MQQAHIVIAMVVHDGRILIRPSMDDASWELPFSTLQDGQAVGTLPPDLAQMNGLQIEIDHVMEPLILESSGQPQIHHAFLCRCLTDSSLPDAGQFKWITPEELLDYEFTPQSQPWIHWLHEHLLQLDSERRRQNELDALRIHQVAKARQAAMRAGSYCLMASIACAVAALDLTWRAARWYFRQSAILRPTLYLAASIFLAILSRRIWQKSAALHREAQHRSLPEPATPPDFSSLSDGSHIVNNLERIQ